MYHSQRRTYLLAFAIGSGSAATLGCAPSDGTEADGTWDVSDADGGADALEDKIGAARRYEAEDHSATQGCSQQSNHAGFTGAGFIDYGGNGTWIEWNGIVASAAGQYKLSFRHANGSRANRGSALLVNGSNAGSVAFAPTGAWTTWRNENVTVMLRAGNNTVRVLANSASGGTNLDHVAVTPLDLCTSDPAKVEPGQCGCGVPEGSCGGSADASCASADEDSSVTLSCPAGRTISGIPLASYGTPTGSCAAGFQVSACNASTSQQKVVETCLGKQSCSVAANNGVFGDPCAGTAKRLLVHYACSVGTVDACPNDPNKTQPGECGCGVPEGTCGPTVGPVLIGRVYFAQTHVLEPESPLFKLVSAREALLKVQVTGTTVMAAPTVSATLRLGDRTAVLSLKGPSTLSTGFASAPGAVQHRYEDSFTVRIPQDWVQPGLSVSLRAGSARRDLTNLKIGAPNKVVMTMFDVNYFKAAPGDYPAGWERELEAKWPTSKLEVRRVRNGSSLS